MEIYTIGFTKSTAERFFDRLAGARTDVVRDVNRRLQHEVRCTLMLGVARAYKAGDDPVERHWLQLNGLVLDDRPVGSTP